MAHSKRPGVYDRDTLIDDYFDGVVFDALTHQWRSIPKAREDLQHLWGEEGHFAPSIWTGGGLFVWGATPGHDAPWGALLDIDAMTWADLRTEGADVPPVRLDANLLTVDDDVFLSGGHAPGSSDTSRRMWRYSLSQETWREIEVPDWADPAYPGAVVGGKLVFLGRCQSGARFDPKTDSWDALTTENGPPSSGRLWGVGDFLAVTDTYYGETETNQVWLLDLRDD